MIANSFELLNSICEKLNLPENVFSIEISANVDEAPVLSVGLRIREEDGETLVEILEEYELRLREPVDRFKEQEAADDIERDRASKSHT